MIKIPSLISRLCVCDWQSTVPSGFEKAFYFLDPARSEFQECDTQDLQRRLLQPLPHGQRAGDELLRTVRQLPAQPRHRKPLPTGGRTAEALLQPELHPRLQAGQCVHWSRKGRGWDGMGEEFSQVDGSLLECVAQQGKHAVHRKMTVLTIHEVIVGHAGRATKHSI